MGRPRENPLWIPLPQGCAGLTWLPHEEVGQWAESQALGRHGCLVGSVQLSPSSAREGHVWQALLPCVMEAGEEERAELESCRPRYKSPALWVVPARPLILCSLLCSFTLKLVTSYLLARGGGVADVQWGGFR